MTIANPQFSSSAELKISAVSRPDIVFNPGDVSFGNVAQGQTPTQNIDVEYAGVLDWRVAGVAANGTPLDIAHEEFYRRTVRDGYRVGYHVKATLQANAPAGDHKWEIFLKTNDPASPLVPVVVSANIQGSLVVTPASLNLTNARLGEEVVRKVLIRGNKQFRILSIEGMGDGISADVPVTSSPSPTQALLIKYKPSKPGDVHRQLQIKTDLQEAPVTLTIDGNVVQ